MDIQQVNSVLNRAIMGLQDGELEAMAEAMASGVTSYNVPPPGMAGRYMPPPPGVLGPKPKQVRRPRLRTKWAKMPIEIAFGPKGKVSATTVDAWVRGVWAVHRNPHGPGWRISHAPTGFATIPNISTDKIAKAVVDQWIAEKPVLLKVGVGKGPDQGKQVAAEVRPYMDFMKRVLKDLRDPKFLKKFPPGIGKPFRGVDPGWEINLPRSTIYDKVMVY